jgi:pimeloyl-ACP methyl ester carboxylesterase
LGGSVVENYLRRAGNADCISKVILDSPALNWGEILRFRLRQGGYPTILFYPSAYFAWLRAGVHIRRISTHAADIAHQTLLIHSSDDPSVPQATSKRIAEVRPDLITFVDFKHGAHARSWNYDRAGYEEAVRAFLS